MKTSSRNSNSANAPCLDSCLLLPRVAGEHESALNLNNLLIRTAKDVVNERSVDNNNFDEEFMLQPTNLFGFATCTVPKNGMNDLNGPGTKTMNCYASKKPNAVNYQPSIPITCDDNDGKVAVVNGLLVHFTIKDLPMECLSSILSFLSYDELSRVRLVCRTFDVVCQQLLNSGFVRVAKYHERISRQIKSQLPRRESERRTHVLSRHVDIVTAIETRISLLSMTYQKYIDNGSCCFIPGKVLDEIYRVLRLLPKMPKGDNAPRSHEVLREFRDISSMAMEHFDEKMVPSFRDKCSTSALYANSGVAAPLVVVRPSSPSSLCSSGGSASWYVFNPTPNVDDGSLFSLAGANSTSTNVLNKVSSDDSNLTSFFGGNATATFQTRNVDVCLRHHRPEGEKLQVEKMKRQMETQRVQLNVYKKELRNIQATLKRQQEKTALQQRLNMAQNRRMDVINKKLLEHENLFAEIMGEMRLNSSVVGLIAARRNNDVKLKRHAADAVDDKTPAAKYAKLERVENADAPRYSLRSTKTKTSSS